MLYVVAAVVMIALAWLIVGGWIASRKRERNRFEQEERYERWRLANREAAVEDMAKVDTLFSVDVNHRTSLVGVSDDGVLIIHYIPYTREAQPADRSELPLSTISRVAIEQRKVGAALSQDRWTWVDVEVRRSAGARALVGGALLGPVGAIAGAASGLQSGTRKERRVETIKTDASYHVRSLRIEAENQEALIVNASDPEDLLRLQQRLVASVSQV